MDTTKAKTTRISTEIRDAIRAELPGLRALVKRLRAFEQEMTATPEHRRWSELFDTPGEDTDEFHELCVYGAIIGTLQEEIPSLQSMIRQIAKETDPAAWAKAKDLAPKERARVARLQASRRQARPAVAV